MLSNITEAQLKRHPGGDLTAVFPEHRVLPRDALTELEGCQSAADLHEALRPCFVKSWPFPRLDGQQVDALRAIIHPEIVLELPLEYQSASMLPLPQRFVTTAPPMMSAQGTTTAFAARSEQNSTSSVVQLAAEAPSLRVLDLRQENHARAVGGGHRLLSGVAGSGKTVILLARAKLLAQRDPATPILVLCYNVTLASFLRGQLQEHANVQVCHFEGWAAANRVRRVRQVEESDQVLGERFLAVLEAGRAPDARRFAAVLVDEAQDFEASWFRCVLAAMQNPTEGDLLIVGDGNQGVYRRGKVSWKALGIQASGRTISGRFGLDIDYRNSREIAALAQVFAEGASASDVGNEDTIGMPSLEVSRCPRATGRKPMLYKESTRQEECARAVQMVKDLLTGCWAGESLPEPLRPEQIGILYRRLTRGDQPLFAHLLDDLQRVAPVRWLNDKDDPKARTRVLEPGVKVQTIHAAKGLQYRAVILLWAGDLPYVPPQSQHDEQAERRLFYVGLTRAEDFLALTAPASLSRSPLTRMVEASKRIVVSPTCRHA